ncbi:MAG: Omp28-related outer membrane protein [Bacteroidales bacterium]|nr:Omp28-related outer membrane protein [Bacteroidales bacterium]
MKKFTFALMALLAAAFTMNAQQYVSTEPANRNVILEEFTGRNCGYCPDGHLIANNIMANNPGRVWAINVHSGSYAPTSYPNFNTSCSATILGGFSVSGFPSGVVNRSTAAAQGRNVWNSLATQQLGQAAECNVAGVVRINPGTRMATITVEVYYTGNSGYDQNYLTVAMLQDSILGSQSGMTSNPAQVVGNQYCHMHILRDVITESAWGDEIAPTTQGTLITKTYEYQIPESIGNPNGVDVILDHVFFLAWVSERFQGTPARPILNACELTKTYMTDQPVYPSMGDLSQVIAASCSMDKDFKFVLTNIGTEALTSVKFNAQIAGATHEFEWTGELPSGDNTKMDFVMEIPFGSYTGTLNIIEANGQPFEASMGFTAESQEWAEAEFLGETTNLKVYIIQDQWGEQITWDIINSAGEIVAEGGPYQHLVGSGSTQANVENIENVPTDECYLFRIYDSNNNGICCNYGNGYYYIKDATGNHIIDGDGDFGSMASHLFSLKRDHTYVDENDASNSLNIYPNPANSKIFVEGENVSVVELYNSLGQKVLTVEGSDNTSVDVASFKNGVYVVRVITNDGSVTTKKVTIAR